MPEAFPCYKSSARIMETQQFASGFSFNPLALQGYFHALPAPFRESVECNQGYRKVEDCVIYRATVATAMKNCRSHNEKATESDYGEKLICTNGQSVFTSILWNGPRYMITQPLGNHRATSLVCLLSRLFVLVLALVSNKLTPEGPGYFKQIGGVWRHVPRKIILSVLLALPSLLTCSSMSFIRWPVVIPAG
ncbi:hypothetical protein BDV37DRAFT_109106 [Aspergillus pseudonomiae]|uniref:Uncharacterized protein n=1 Tax=Aspergillus pseudonomiae TaxID=1506151 RepID=A0A5N7DRT1_9EURO|nr:uncharacterized protein BDV37DRAFT_109106 [Aspergillus pseudonomiae]KAE8409114.1 hypothetical protein BDV37DRAFT_109106 [Aspergillus pseudonomiae]